MTMPIMRHSRDPRTGRRKTVLVTGGTGFIGSHITVALLAEGYHVLLLARGRKDKTARERVYRLLDWFGVGKDQRLKVAVLEGDLERPLLGMDVGTARHLLQNVSETIHCASDTSFSARKREQVQRTNVTGLENLLDIVEKSRCQTFHLISTAYAAGKAEGLCREDFTEAPGFHNVYEETKHRAERIAAARCTRSGITLFIHRPSIVYGDASTGRTLLFNALYYPVRTLHFFQNVYTRDILENNGKSAQALGVHMTSEGALHLPIRIGSADGHGVNLIPVDHFIRAFFAIRNQSPQGGIFHIVNDSNTPIREILNYTRRFFHLSGIRIAAHGEFSEIPRNGLEMLFENQIKVYGPYMRDQRIFDHSRASAILSGQNISPPVFSYDIFTRCMDYALKVDWGRRLHRERNGSCPGKSPTDTKRFYPRKSAG